MEHYGFKYQKHGKYVHSFSWGQNFHIALIVVHRITLGKTYTSRVSTTPDTMNLTYK